MTAAVAAVLYRMQRWQSLAFVALSVSGALVINTALKLVFIRQRPELWELLTHESTYSFPSGHAAMSSALALTIIVLVWNSRWRGPVVGIGALYVLAIGFSRLYLGVHYPTDVLAGWIVSAIWVFIAYKITISSRHQRSVKHQE
jgi:undecaprenyl-diphosphatase